MFDFLLDSLIFFPRGLIYVALGIVVLIIAKAARDITIAHSEVEEIAGKRNLAEGLRFSGYLLAVVLVFVGAIYQPSQVALANLSVRFDAAFGLEIVRVLLYAIAGIVALNLLRVVMDRLILYKFDVTREIIQEQNVGTGAVEFGANVAAGLIIAGTLSGGSGDGILTEALTTLVFFVLGMATMVLFALFYELTVSFDIHGEIETSNSAVGVAFCGNLIAIGLIMFKAVSGDFRGWLPSITEFFIFAVIGFVLLYVVRLLVDWVIIHRVAVSREIGTNGNMGVAFVESSVVISASLVLLFAI